MKADMHIHSNNFYRRESKFKAMLHKYENLGYTDLYFTDHFNRQMFQEGYELDRFFEPVLKARSLTNINIHAGAEVKLDTGLEFLVYNNSMESFKKITEVKTLEQLKNNVDTTAIIIQAHPYRSKRGTPTLVHPNVDGYEINTHPKHITYANNNLVHKFVTMVDSNYIITIGSDAHNIHAVGAASLTSTKSIHDALISRKFMITRL